MTSLSKLHTDSSITSMNDVTNHAVSCHADGSIGSIASINDASLMLASAPWSKWSNLRLLRCGACMYLNDDMGVHVHPGTIVSNFRTYYKRLKSLYQVTHYLTLVYCVHRIQILRNVSDLPAGCVYRAACQSGSWISGKIVHRAFGQGEIVRRAFGQGENCSSGIWFCGKVVHRAFGQWESCSSGVWSGGKLFIGDLVLRESCSSGVWLSMSLGRGDRNRGDCNRASVVYPQCNTPFSRR